LSYRRPDDWSMRKNRKKPATRKSGPSEACATSTHWHHVADWYDQLVGDEGSEYHQQVIIPGLLRLLNIRPAMKILDIACGQGVACRALAQQGALVTGVDAAPALIEAARRRNEKDHLPITYLVGDATRLTTHADLAGQSFDAAVCVLAIQNLTPLSPVWQGCKALLKPGGPLVLVLMHPTFRIPKHSSWGWDEAAAVQYRRVDQYLTSSKAEIQMHPGAAPSETTTTFHRPLQAYVNTLGNAGLLIDRIDEWTSHKTSQAGPKKAALDRSRKEIPMFMAIRALACG
jgi:2-polyprenyl-3-methyl-5-hydroxy-6-metoxy-1,4-benzoquinol methylase